MNSSRKWLVLHPFFFALYPLLELYTKNVDEVPPDAILRPGLVLLTIFLLSVLFLRLIFKDWGRAAWLTSWFILLVLYLDYSSSIPSRIIIAGLILRRGWIVLAIWIFTSFLAGSNLFWKRFGSPVLTGYLNLVGGILLIFVAISLGRSIYEAQFSGLSARLVNDVHPHSGKKLHSDLPDIYYIIVDGYGRADMLEDIYGFDNSQFISYLKERGFYVADHSKSNYMQTGLSLSSSLSLDYLKFDKDLTQSHSRKPMSAMIKDSIVRKFLQENGYRTVSLQTGYELTDIRDAEVYFPYIYRGFTEFEYLFINSSGLKYFFSLLNVNTATSGNEKHRDRILYEFKQLQKTPSIEGPKFVFFHVVAPHPPFLFDSQGNPTNEEQPYWIGDGNRFRGTPREYIQGYNQQITYINRLLEKSIDAILANSPKPPVILLQGDHGPGAYLKWESFKKTCHDERFAILNAYFFPEGRYEQLYENISPVNSFRVLFNHYFATKLELLEDRQYFSRLSTPYGFMDASSVSDSQCSIARQ